MPEPATRSVTGTRWRSYGDDIALIGGVTVGGLALAIVQLIGGDRALVIRHGR